MSCLLTCRYVPGAITKVPTCRRIQKRKKSYEFTMLMVGVESLLLDSPRVSMLRYKSFACNPGFVSQ